MKPKFPDRRALIVILAVAVPIVAALGYVGWQLEQRPNEARVQALIEERLAQRQSEQVSEDQLSRLEQNLAKAMAGRKGKGSAGELSETEFNVRVEKGIVAFVEKQRQATEERPNQLAKKVAPPGKGDHIYGNPAAPVSFIEYSDFECPFCKGFHVAVKQFIDDSKGQVNWVYRHFPLEFHNPGAQKQAEASECVAELGGNDVFWKFADAIYARTRSNGQGFPLDNLAPLAAEVGLDKAAFQKCFDSGKFARKVQSQTAEGQRAGVNGTPGNIMFRNKNGQVVAMHGAQPMERFRDVAEGLLRAN